MSILAASRRIDPHHFDSGTALKLLSLFAARNFGKAYPEQQHGARGWSSGKSYAPAQHSPC